MDKSCVLSAGGTDKDDTNLNIILIIKDTKLYVPEVTLSTKDNQKLLNLCSKRFEGPVYWNDEFIKK